MKPWTNKKSGFTIVELLIVVVVIAILAAITIVSYNGIQQRAKESSVQADVSNALKKIEVYRFQNSTTEDYPLTLADAGYVSSTTLNYMVNNSVNPKMFCLSAENGAISYFVTQSLPKPTAGDCIVKQGLVGWWRMNGNTQDSSGNAYHGTATALTATTGQNGVANSAYTFSLASSSRIALPDAAAIVGNNPYTISAWFKSSSAGMNGIIGWGTWGTSSTVTALRLASPPVGLSHYWWDNDQVVSFADVANNQWHHVVASSDGAYQRLYADGNLIGTRTPSATHNASATSVAIGRTNASEYFNGQLDDVRVYNRAINQTEISTLYSAGAQ